MLSQRFLQVLNRQSLLSEKLLVAYSGGADSTCLLTLCHEAGLDVVAAHLHHGQRKEADQELELCAAYCESLNIPFISGRADVPKIAKDFGLSIEEAGRRARYEFFEKAAWQFQCTAILTGHTQDDHVETVLLNLTRGAGMRGLTGIPERRDNIVRPILNVTREETRGFCAERGLWFHDDPANDDLHHARSRIRASIVPVMRELHPGFDAAVCRMTEIISQEDQYLDSAAAGALENLVVSMNGPLEFLTRNEEVCLDRQGLAHLPEVLLNRAIRLVCRVLGAELSREITESVKDAIQEADLGAFTAEGGDVTLQILADKVHIYRQSNVVLQRGILQTPGDTLADSFGWMICADHEGEEPFVQDSNHLKVTLDRSAIKGDLHLVGIQDGMKIQPINFDGTKLIGDIATDRKLSQLCRRKLPVVCDMVGPIWVPGIAVADRTKVTPHSSAKLWLSFGPVSD